MSPYDTPFLNAPRRGGNWLQRIAFAAIGAVVLVSLFFFVAAALVAGALLALGVAVRWWWVMRRLRRQAKAAEALEGEYSVVERAAIDTHRLER